MSDQIERARAAARELSRCEVTQIDAMAAASTGYAETVAELRLPLETLFANDPNSALGLWHEMRAAALKAMSVLLLESLVAEEAGDEPRRNAANHAGNRVQDSVIELSAFLPEGPVQ